MKPWKLLKDLDLSSKAYVLTQGFSLYSFQHKMELDRMGLRNVNFWISGGIDEYEIPAYAPMLRVWRGHENRKRAGVRFRPQNCGG